MSMQTGHNPKAPTDTHGNQVINTNKHQGQILGDGTSNRVVDGFQKDGFGEGEDYGFKVSKSGFDVLTATDDQLVMSSAFNMFKIVGVYEIPVFHDGTSGTTATGSVGHGLAFTPAYAAYLDFGDGTTYTALPYISDFSLSASPGNGVQIMRFYSCTVGPEFFVASVNISGATKSPNTYNFKVYAFRETIT